MINLLKETFALTNQGAKDTLKAGIISIFTYMSYMIPAIIIMLFTQGVLSNNLESSQKYWILIGAAAVIIFIIKMIEYNATFTTTYQECANLRIDIANILKKLPLSYFSKHNLADLSQTIMKDVSNIEQSLSHAIPQAIGFTIYFIIMAAMMIIGNIFMGLTIVVPVLISFTLLILSKKIQIKGATAYYDKLRDNSDAFQEAIEMQQEINSYGRQTAITQTINRKLEDTEKIHIKAESVMAILMNLSIVILKCVLGFTIIVGSYLFSIGHISLLFMLGYLLAAVKIVDGLEGIYEYLATMFFFDASYARIKDLRNHEIQEGKDTEFTGYDIEFRNVEFAYNSTNKVLNKASFTAKQNQVTALVGPSGCGKTTALRLMSRLYDYDGGQILIGGKELKNFSTEALFEKVSIVFQDVMLFNTSILENIRIGKKGASNDEVIAAAKLANVDSFVSKLPDGYSTVVGENGSKLSGGERQRISIARAILKDAPIIILDEISASLDVENEMQIQGSLNTLIKNKTVVIISHRMKSIENVDNIVVMKDGHVEASGKHNDLINTCEMYKTMVSRSNLSESYIY